MIRNYRFNLNKFEMMLKFNNDPKKTHASFPVGDCDNCRFGKDRKDCREYDATAEILRMKIWAKHPLSKIYPHNFCPFWTLKKRV